MSEEEFQPFESENIKTLEIGKPESIEWILGNHLGEVGCWILADAQMGISCGGIQLKYLPIGKEGEYTQGKVTEIIFYLKKKFVTEDIVLTLRLGQGNLPRIEVLNTDQSVRFHFAEMGNRRIYSYNPNPTDEFALILNEEFSLLLECFTTTSAYLRAISLHLKH